MGDNMKKAFTLVELLVIIAILGMIAIIAIPQAMSFVESTRTAAYRNLENQMKRSAQNYFVVNPDLLPTTLNTSRSVSLQELVDSRAINKIVDSKTGEFCDGYISVTKVSDNKYEYKPYLSCSSSYITGNYMNNQNVVSNLYYLYYNFDDFQEPTVNLAPDTNYSNRIYNQVYTAMGWGGDTGTAVYRLDGGPDGLPSKQMTKSTPGTGGVYMDDNRNINIEPLQTYTVSGWVRAVPNINTQNGHFLNINRIADNHYILAGAINLTSNWIRHSWTFTANSTQGGLYQSRNIIYNDEVSPIDIFWSGFQVENKPYATPFVNGTRMGTVADLSNSNNNAPLGQTTTPRWVDTGRVSGAYLFNGTSTYIETNDNVATDNKTYAMFIRPTNLTSNGVVFSNHNTALNANLSLRVINNKAVLNVYNSSGTLVTHTSNSNLTTSWNHVSIAQDSNEVRLYINGVLDSRLTITMARSSEKIIIGARKNGATYENFFNGSVDEFIILKGAQQENAINQLYNSY